MLPWIRVPKEKSYSRQMIEPGRRVEEEADPVLADQRMLETDREPVLGHPLVPAGIAAVEHQRQGLPVLGHVAQVRVARGVVERDRAHLAHVGRDVQGDGGIGGQRVDLAADLQVRPVHEHRRAADHPHVLVAEAEALQVVPGELAADSDRRRAVQHRRHEPLGHRVDAGRSFVFALQVGLGADADDGDRNREAVDHRGQRFQGVDVARTECVGQRDHDVVVVGVDPGRRCGGDTRGLQVVLGSGQQPVGGLTEHQIAGVAPDQVAFEGGLGVSHRERILVGTDEDPGHSPESKACSRIAEIWHARGRQDGHPRTRVLIPGDR